MRGSLVSDGPTITQGSGGSGDYNLRVGPIRFLAEATGGFEYIDNINYSEHNRQSDEIVRFSSEHPDVVDDLAVQHAATRPGCRLHPLHPASRRDHGRRVHHARAASWRRTSTSATASASTSTTPSTSGRTRSTTPQLSNVTNFRPVHEHGGRHGGDATSTRSQSRPVTTISTIKSLSSEFDYLNRSSDSVLGIGGVQGAAGDSRSACRGKLFLVQLLENNNVNGDFLTSQGVVVSRRGRTIRGSTTARAARSAAISTGRFRAAFRLDCARRLPGGHVRQRRLLFPDTFGDKTTLSDALLLEPDAQQPHQCVPDAQPLGRP